MYLKKLSIDFIKIEDNQTISTNLHQNCKIKLTVQLLAFQSFHIFIDSGDERFISLNPISTANFVAARCMYKTFSF